MSFSLKGIADATGGSCNEGHVELAPGVQSAQIRQHQVRDPALPARCPPDVLVVETDEGPVVLAGDVTYDLGALAVGGSPAVDRVRALSPRRVYISHVAEPWEPNVD